MPILDYYEPTNQRLFTVKLMELYGISKDDCIPIETIYPEYDPITSTLKAKELYKSGDKYDIIPLDEGTIASNLERVKMEKFNKLRTIRNKLLAKTDYLLTVDYKISEEDLEEVKTYRQALRDITKLEGAPWDGGGVNTPWPEKPKLVSMV